MENLKKVYLFNHSNSSHPSVEVVVYMFLSLKGRQSSIIWSVLFSFFVPLLPLAVTHCHLFSLVVTLSFVVPFVVIRFHSLYHSLSFVVIRCTTRCHSFSFLVTRCTTRLSFYKRSILNTLLIDNDIAKIKDIFRNFWWALLVETSYSQIIGLNMKPSFLVLFFAPIFNRI